MLAEGLRLYMSKLEPSEMKVIMKNFLLKQSTIPDPEPVSGATTGAVSLVGSPDRSRMVAGVDSSVRMQTFGQQASPVTRVSAVQTDLFN